MNREEMLFSRNTRRFFKEDQEIVREYNKTLINFPSDRTVAEEEDLIINKFSGKKLDLGYFYEHLDDFVFDSGGSDYLKGFSICDIIAILLVYISSCDKINVYIASFLSNHTLRTNEYEEKFSSALCYFADGIFVYPSEIPPEVLYREKTRIISDLQKRVLDYDKKLIETKGNIVSSGRSIKEEEDIIFNKFGGKKIEPEYFYEHINELIVCVTDPEYYKTISVGKIIADVSEEIIPDEYFYGLYLLTLDKDERFPFKFQNKLVVYIASRDGVNVYISAFVTNRPCRSREFEKMLSSQLYYAEDGIVVFEDELP